MGFSVKAPILLIIFNRPDLLIKQIESLRKIKPKKIYVSCDGPRLNNELDEVKIQECRELISNEVSWECEIFLNYQDVNLGCGACVSQAIDWFFRNEEFGIILEDDCIVSESFYDFAEYLLIKYRYDSEIAGICADFKIKGNRNKDNKYGLISYPLIWGWASWRRVWDLYDYSIADWDGNTDKLLGLQGAPSKSKQYWASNFNKIIGKRIDTWDYQFSYLVLKRGMKFIHPMRNLVTNIGFGADATHTKRIFDKTNNLPRFEVSKPYELDATYDEYNEYLTNSYFYKKSKIKKLIECLLMVI